MLASAHGGLCIILSLKWQQKTCSYHNTYIQQPHSGGEVTLWHGACPGHEFFELLSQLKMKTWGLVWKLKFEYKIFHKNGSDISTRTCSNMLPISVAITRYEIRLVFFHNDYDFGIWTQNLEAMKRNILKAMAKSLFGQNNSICRNNKWQWSR